MIAIRWYIEDEHANEDGDIKLKIDPAERAQGVAVENLVYRRIHQYHFHIL
jgi:predicted acetyltransferase